MNFRIARFIHRSGDREDPHETRREPERQSGRHREPDLDDRETEHDYCRWDGIALEM